MSNRSHTPSPLEVFRLMKEYRARWVVPTVAFAAVALLYALFKSDTWEAAQALVVRNEAHGPTDRPGKFAQADEMKTLQETIVELTRSDSVLETALRTAGPKEAVAPDSAAALAWPTAQDVEDLRGAVKVTPPNGAELGKTEVFYVKVEANDRDRALALTAAIVDGLQERFQKLQGDKAASMIQEIERTAQLADNDLAAATKKLAEFEKNVGSDLSELRILNDTPSGNSDLRQKVVAVENELRDAITQQRAAAELAELLRQAKHDETRLVALPDRLLKSHATLSRLIEGLSQARLRTSTMLGSKSAAHPLVIAAKAEEQEVVADLAREVDNSIRIALVEEKLQTDRVETLKSQLAGVHTRLERLAGLRAEYGNRVAEVKSREKLAEEARSNLAEARASQAAATSANLINRIDEATTGARPIGPGKSMIVLAGMTGGLLFGFALVFLTVPAAETKPAAPVTNGTAWKTHQSQTVESLVKSTGALSLKQALSKISQQSSRWN
jgi:succinoglycan biosynthesis transport protein ExoP